jgi:hypothetical protein
MVQYIDCSIAMHVAYLLLMKDKSNIPNCPQMSNTLQTLKPNTILTRYKSNQQSLHAVQLS